MVPLFPPQINVSPPNDDQLIPQRFFCLQQLLEHTILCCLPRFVSLSNPAESEIDVANRYEYIFGLNTQIVYEASIQLYL